MESLGLAALSIGAVMAAPVQFGWGVSRKMIGAFAYAATLVLACLAVASGLAWADLFLPFTSQSSTAIEAVAILFGFSVQPFFAFVIARGIWG